MLKVITLLAATALVLATPRTSYATPILYSVSGTATDLSGSMPGIAAVTGNFAISSVPLLHGATTPPFDSNSMVEYHIESYTIDIAGSGLEHGAGFLLIEAEGPRWGGLDNIGEVSVGFYHSDGSPYLWAGPAESNLFYPHYFSLAPIITISSRFSDPHLDLTLTEVPEPATLLLLGTGVAALVAARRRRR